MIELTQKKLLIIGAGLLQTPVINAANEMGITTIVVDGNPEAVGIRFADHFIHSSTLDPEKTLKEVIRFTEKHFPIDGVLTVGTDASYTVAVCAKHFNLPGISPESALKATDKFIMRKTLKKADVSVPEFGRATDIHQAQKVFEKLGGDCVIKPVKNMGARGVRRINNASQLEAAFMLAQSFSVDGDIIIEQFIDAPELSIDALIYDGEIFITGVADRIIEYPPYFVETGHILPSGLPDDIIHYGVELFKRGIHALAINHGAAKGDIKVSENTAYVGEIAARLSGGFMSAYTYPYATGVNLMKNVVRIALGFSPEDLKPKREWVAIERAVIAPPGIVNSIEGVDEAREIEFVKNVFVDTHLDDRIISPQNNLDKSGHIIVCAPTRVEALNASHKAISTIKIRTRMEETQIIPKNIILDNARKKLNGRCYACSDCNGKWCRGKMPGVGGIDSGLGFIRAVQRVRDIELIPHYINSAKVIDTTLNFLDTCLDIPILPAPITGAVTNLGGAITEIELARAIVKGANQAGTCGVVGDGATPTKYKIGIQVVMENFGFAIPFFKPRYDQNLILQRIQAAKEVGAMAVGMDIDAASFLTMTMKKQNTSTKSFEELKELVDFAEIPFVLKGILSPRDAELAVKAGVKVIIVSNHGGRVGASLVVPIDALSDIKSAVGDDVFIVLDGGIRSGPDAAKAIALGADAVMIGRPVMVSAVGAGMEGVRQYFLNLTYGLKRIMSLIGTSNLSELKNNRDVLRLKPYYTRE